MTKQEIWEIGTCWWTYVRLCTGDCANKCCLQYETGSYFFL